MTTADVPKLVGTRVKRREDPRLITGHATYVDDIQLPRTLSLGIRRSEYAHARIVGIDTAAAKAMPGVVAVLTAADIESMMVPLPSAPATPDNKLPMHYPLAKDKVRHVGDPVAVVLAEDRYQARDAIEAIAVEYEELPAVVDLDAAVQPGSPKVHDEFDDNIAYYWTLPDVGDVDAAFANAAVVVKQRMVSQRLMGTPLETRAILAQWQPGEEHLTLWSSTQIPHLLRPNIAGLLGLREVQVRVIAPEVGGGFGVKLEIYAEEALCAALSRLTERPVKYVESRSENFQATVQGRGQVAYYELAANHDGKVMGLRVKILADMGAYCQLFTNIVPTLSGLMIPGSYTIPALKPEIYGVFTNKTATGAYRGAGRPEATYYIERMMDLLALELKLDPVEVRRRNLIPTESFPYTTTTGMVYDSGNYPPAIDKALAMVDYEGVRKQQQAGPQNGKYLGIGVSTWTEICGFGPSAAVPGGGWEYSRVGFDRSGMITVGTGVSPHGQGQETSFAQIVADEFGVPIENIKVVHGDTDKVPHGVGTFGSRATVVGGASIMMSVTKVKTKMKQLAAQLMDASEDDLEVGNGRVWVKGSPDRGVGLAEVVGAAYNATNLPPGAEPGLEATSYYEPANFTFPFGVHVAVVEVDAETGAVTLKRYVGVDDCGTVINPLLVDGQVHGGVAQGIGQALFEEVVHDDRGQLISGTLMDYALPHAEDFPWIETDGTVTVNPLNPLGAKGIGEAGTIASTPAVASAVIDALKPFGVRHLDMPLKPEKLWRAMHAGAQG